MVGSPVVIGRKVQQLLAGARQATLPSQFAKAVRHLSIVAAVGGRVIVSRPIHREGVPDALIDHERPCVAK
jgi:hypothetical protein